MSVRVALVHYWLVGMRGGEKVLEALGELYPDADIYTHAYAPDKISESLRRHTIRTTFVGRLPRATRAYQSYLPLMPLALEQLDLRAYDLVISSESGPAKGVLTSPEALHVCYCHSPMRYAWDLYHDYAREAGPLKRLVMPALMHYLRLWDHAGAARVDHFVANSHHVARRIRRHYGRDAQVVYPPVDTAAFPVGHARQDYYLFVGQLVPYKRADLAIEALGSLGRRLVVIGAGEQAAALRRAAGPHVELLGWQPASVLAEHYARCKALVFPGHEDFGMVPVEAMAAGAPVIAYGRGGALETVVDDETGILFHEQSAASLRDAVLRFEARPGGFSPEVMARHAARFGRERFSTEMRQLVDRLLATRHRPGQPP